MLTMLLGGLWHGAAWTFVVWGVFHGVMPGAAPAACARRLERDAAWRPRPAGALLAGCA